MDTDTLYEFINALGLAHSSPMRGGGKVNISIRCPFHQEDGARKYDASICSRSDGVYLFHCFGAKCGESHSLGYACKLLIERGYGALTPLASRLNLDTADAVIARAKSVVDRRDKRGKLSVKSRAKDEPKIDFLSAFEDMSEDLPDDALDFLASRGLDPYLIQSVYHLRWDKRKARLVTPFVNVDGDIAGLSGRSFRGNRLEKLTYRGTRRDVCVGEHLLDHGDRVVFCEGQSDAYSLYQALNPDGHSVSVLAICGSGFPERMRGVLDRLKPRSVMIAGDGDAAGIKWSRFAYRVIGDSAFFPVYFFRCPAGKDPGQMTPDEIRVAFENAPLITGPGSIKLAGDGVAAKKK